MELLGFGIFYVMAEIRVRDADVSGDREAVFRFFW